MAPVFFLLAGVALEMSGPAAIFAYLLSVWYLCACFRLFPGICENYNVAEVIKDSSKNLPRALIESVALVTVLYILNCL